MEASKVLALQDQLTQPMSVICDEGVVAGPALSSVRGLIPLHNWRGLPFRVTDVHRAFNYLVSRQEILQCDVMANGVMPNSIFPSLEYIRNSGKVLPSLRTDAATPPTFLPELAEFNLETVFLTPRDPEGPELDAWLDMCSQIEVPVRIQLSIPPRGLKQMDSLVERWREYGARSVLFRLRDPFLCRSATIEAREPEQLNLMKALSHALLEQNIAVQFIGYPVEVLEASLARYAIRPDGFMPNHQHYTKSASAFALAMFQKHPKLARLMLIYELARLADKEDSVDRFLTTQVERYYHWLYKPSYLLSKSWRTLHVFPKYNCLDTISPDSEGFSRDFTHSFPSIHLKHAPRFELLEQAPKLAYYDRTNYCRLNNMYVRELLTRRALEWQRNAVPTSTWGEDNFGSANSLFNKMSGAEQWWSATGGEKISTPLPLLQAPFIVSVTFGGGVAELLGFRINRTQAVLCPMVEQSHTLTLYVDENGQYVLLRDDQAVEPVTVEEKTRLPLRFPNQLHLFLSIWNINDTLHVTSIKAWSGAPLYQLPKPGVKYSIALFCSRFARRLSAALRCIAHQQDFDLSKLEILVAYVPGLDPTEDVLDSIRLAHPELRVLHVPLTAQNVRSKGYALNEAMKMASGDWIMLMDADILLPPYMFSRLETLTENQVFMAPIGRAMLDRETTARVLLGEIEPWRDWESLMGKAIEVRDREAQGVPIGFNQIFKKSCLDKVSYQEYEHFQGADWEFGAEMRRHFGEEHRIDIRVLHLDHGGSQWYGVQKQF